ncbi:CARDB domain-containing protein [Hyalangium rubrum]|uniref:CARDB domain-containing protein n=1 Tax=Hyalangium rubrum TaxID=3103134 RepID=A0ABU5H0Q5_9BACT|nr:CARDB domain-containing protein [Hyalangium sp. s54d21]MDY7227028.1 CARDB domain-containing protein [Hyalangium sp. s54d21]
MNRRTGRVGSLLGAVALLATSGCESSADSDTAVELEATSQAVVSGPDFVVSAVTGPASATPGQQLTASVTLCNQGTQGGDTHVEVYLSTDTTITPHGPTAPSPDTYFGSASAQYLNAGQCQTLTVQGSAYVPADGAYYLGAVADPQNSVVEVLETNNAKAGTRLGIGNKPDFVVSAVTGPASVMPGGPGQQFPSSVTVCNQGTQGGSTPVEVYLSADTTITPNGPMAPSPDSYVGSVHSQYLNPGQCQTLTLQGSPYVPTEGAYYLGAVADPQGFTAELLEDNNIKLGGRIGIGNKPDFVVSTVTGPASALPGQQLSASVTVCNQGTVGGSAPVEVYLSTDTTITPNGPTAPSPDSYVGSASTQYLNAGQCQTLTVQGSAYVPAEGPYYLGAVADPQRSVVELIEDNNAKAGTRLGIGNKPDFVVSAVTGPASIRPGQQFTASVTVCNQGTQGGSAPAEVYLSADNTITPHGPTAPSPDSYVGVVSPQYLNPGQCQTLTVQGSAYVPADGPYYLGAVVDPQASIAELIENNNARAGTRLGIGNKPDFVVSAVTGPASVMQSGPGQQFPTSVTVCNEGTQPGSTHVEVYLSADTTITPYGPAVPSPDPFLGHAASEYLSPGQCQTLTVHGSAYVPTEGAYYLGAVADPQGSIAELLEDNNIKLGDRIGVGSKPDFVVSTVTGPASALPGQSLSASVTVCNQGTVGGSAPVEVYLSADTTITPNGPMAPSPDAYVGSASTQYLNAGQCQTLAVQGYAYVPTEGAYSLGAVVDPQSSLVELIEDNNAKAGTRLGIGNKPDFVVSAVTGPASIRPGQQFTASVTVCNQGTQGGSAPAEVYLSADRTITPHGPTAPSPDSYVGVVSPQYLTPGQCQTLTVQGYAYVPADGPYYLGAVVDPQASIAELIEDNNAKAGSRIGIGYKPDFVVSAVSSVSTVQLGQQLTASVTVCNQGTQAGSTYVETYLSADTTITLNGPMGPSPDTLMGYKSTATLSAGQCQVLSVVGPAYVPGTGKYYVGAVADPYSDLQEMFEDNNTKVGTLVTVTP